MDLHVSVLLSSVSTCLSNIMRNLIFNRSLDSEDCKLTAGAAFVPQDSFQSGSKHKPHILQQSLWAEEELQLLAATARESTTSVERACRHWRWRKIIMSNFMTDRWQSEVCCFILLNDNKPCFLTFSSLTTRTWQLFGQEGKNPQISESYIGSWAMKRQLPVWKLQCFLIAAASPIPANLMLHPSNSIVKV